ncbi:molybdenum cofactor biosynthesis protein C [Candidatus Bathyarchaeota archaeon RBG_16_48_13]|nr:MAG: molybdenum cofactor biosynthesis protein C [Candidatus Bathyarchaeota archaeon RBG_16_48_13]
MIDITSKPEIYREAVAQGSIKLRPETVRRIREGSIEKGDPLSVAKVAGILAAKNTSSLIPLCHPLPLTNVEVDLEIADESTVKVEATVKTRAQTGVEMEALTAASVALLTIWDMTKKYEKDDQGQYPTTKIESIRVVRKIKRNIA